jgi:hypothetical protein
MMEVSTMMRATTNSSVTEHTHATKASERIMHKTTSLHNTGSSSSSPRRLDDPRPSCFSSMFPPSKAALPKADPNDMITSPSKQTMTKTALISDGSALRSMPGRSMRKLYETTSSTRSLNHNNPDSSWYNLDSVHSAKMMDLNDDDDDKNNDSVVSMQTSSSSFASFGESGGDDVAAMVMASRAFTKLVEAPTPRSILLKQQSSRLRRGASYRGSSLALIDETMNLD